MGWFCNTPEAIEQMKICNENNCPDCEKCIWITESYNAMTEYGTVVEKPRKTKTKKRLPEIKTKWERLAKQVTVKQTKNNHPLYDLIMEKFKGEEI